MAEKGNPFSPGFSSRCAVSPVIAGEGVFMLHSFLLGVIITFIYDLFRILRRIIPHGWFLLSLEDLAFWILATAGSGGFPSSVPVRECFCIKKR